MIFKRKKRIKPESFPQEAALDQETIERELKKKESKAQNLFANSDNWEGFFIQVSEKLKKHLKVFTPITREIKLLFQLVQDIYKKRYNDFPFASMITVVASLIYFLSPFDLLPDFLPFLGFTDDLSVLVFIITNIKTDLDKYRQWLEENPSESEEEPEKPIKKIPKKRLRRKFLG